MPVFLASCTSSAKALVKPEESRSAEDIVADVVKNAGLKLVTKGGGQDGG